MNIKVALLTFVLFCSIPLYAQDPQYSQVYANALYLSPAFAGAEQNTRAIFATRYQWPGLDASFISNTFSVDHYIDRYKSGIGLIALPTFLVLQNYIRMKWVLSMHFRQRFQKKSYLGQHYNYRM